MWEIKILFDTIYNRDFCREYLLNYIKVPEDERWEYIRHTKNKWLTIQITGFTKYVQIMEYCISHVDNIYECKIKKVGE